MATQKFILFAFQIIQIQQKNEAINSLYLYLSLILPIFSQ